jgi:membrane fusion protein (multidrug efflux system)
VGHHRLAHITHSTARLAHAAAKTAASRQEVALERARLALSYTEITAPFAGVVAERQIRVGDTVGSAEPAYVLTDTDNLRAVFYRPQEELDLFRTRESDGTTRLTLTATAEAYPGETFEGTIERVSPTIDAESGQFRVTARMTPGEGRARLLPGMLVRLLIVTDRHADALVVPKRALRREGERRYLLVADRTSGAERTLRRVEVTESFSDEEYVEVESEGELGPGTEVVVVGSPDLSPGDPVVADDGGALVAPEVALPDAGEPAANDTGADADESGTE